MQADTGPMYFIGCVWDGIDTFDGNVTTCVNPKADGFVFINCLMKNFRKGIVNNQAISFLLINSTLSAGEQGIQVNNASAAGFIINSIFEDLGDVGSDGGIQANPNGGSILNVGNILNWSDGNDYRNEHVGGVVPASVGPLLDLTQTDPQVLDNKKLETNSPGINNGYPLLGGRTTIGAWPPFAIPNLSRRCRYDGRTIYT